MKMIAFRLMLGCVCLRIVSAFAQEPSTEMICIDDATIGGQQGDAGDPDLDVHGYTAFGTNYSLAYMVTSGVGNVFVEKGVEVGSNVWVDGAVGVDVATSVSNILDVANHAFQVNALGDMVCINRINYSWPTNSPEPSSRLIAENNTQLVWQTKTPRIITIVSNEQRIPWFNQPSALTELASNTCFRFVMDLSSVQQAQLKVFVQSTGAVSATFGVQYSTNLLDWSYLDDVAEPVVGINVTGSQVSAWEDISENAKQDVYLRVVGEHGDESTDPYFGNIYVQFR